MITILTSNRGLTVTLRGKRDADILEEKLMPLIAQENDRPMGRDQYQRVSWATLAVANGNRKALWTALRLAFEGQFVKVFGGDRPGIHPLERVDP